MTNRSAISRQLELELAEKEEKRKQAKKKEKAKKFFKMQSKGSPGPGMDFPTSQRKRNKKGGKIMVGYKTGGKV
tara:strand:- start:823 stop:1044 length:222 start_codon:yes stop_codon:yes gene_type:complete